MADRKVIQFTGTDGNDYDVRDEAAQQKIGTTALPTTAQTLTGAIAEHESDITNLTAEANSLKSALTQLRTDVGDGRLYENGAESTSEYYKGFTILKKNVTYKLKVTAHSTGTYTLASSTVATSSGIVDTIGSADFTTNVPVYFIYTPTADVYFLRLWVCTDWDVDAYETESAWDAILDLEDKAEEIEQEADETATAITKGFKIVENKNKINESEIIPNKRYNSSGSLVDSSSGFVVTGGIPITANEKVYFSVEEGGARRVAGMWYLILFSSDGTTVLDYNNDGVENYTAQSNGILHFSWKPGTTITKPFCGTIPDPSYYDEYGYTYIAKQAEKCKPYSGVVWACVGDSMTATGTSAKKHYYDYIAEELGFIVLNYGVSGTGYAAQAENNKAFYQRIANITDSFDFITILGSVNDLAVDLPLGTYEDSGTTTIAGYVNAAIDAIYTIAPFTKIGIISQPPTVGTSNNGHLIGTEAQAYSDLLGQICKNRGIPFLNLFNCSGLKPWDSSYRAEYYNEDGSQDSGVHPNSKGQEQMSTKIREFIKTVCNLP